MNDALTAGFMSEAVQAAAQGVSRGDGGPFGAVIVRDEHVVASAWNRVILDVDPTSHAEVNVIRAACRILGRFHLEDCELYTSCEPCPMCLGAIYWARLRTVHYAATRDDASGIGFDDSLIYGELAANPENRRIRFIKTDASEAQTVMRAWQAHASRRTY